MKKKILITGGAGYIGSHFVHLLMDEHANEYEPIVIDDLSKGHKDAIPEQVRFYEGNIGDEALFDTIFRKNKNIFAVAHFAGFIEAGESMKDPQKYILNNTLNTAKLLKAMIKHQCKHIIFSSTAAVYGEPEYTPIDEQHPTKPTNYYGLSKLMIEQMLDSYEHAYDLKSVRLRYFNAAGAHPEAKTGEAHDPETHLIPLTLFTALGKRKKLFIFGTDYETRDGTCVRDYVHVIDLARAHILALQKIEMLPKKAVFNIGSQKGFTVKEIITETENVTGKTIPTEEQERRPGDPAVLIASSEKIQKELGWNPEASSMRNIIETAYQWHQQQE